MKFVYDDGGRALSGFKGHAGDCVARSIAIASGRFYQEVYDMLAEGNASQRLSKRSRKKGRSARNGVYVGRKWFKDLMTKLGFVWTATMTIGSGCKVHLHDGELPMGRLVVSVSKHYTAVIDGVIHDTFDPQRESSWIKVEDGVETRGLSRRCVYGYWKKV